MDCSDIPDEDETKDVGEPKEVATPAAFMRPCRKKNGFFAFLNEHGATLRAMHPNMKGQRFRIRMGQVWQKLSSEEKQKYVNQEGNRPLPISSLGGRTVTSPQVKPRPIQPAPEIKPMQGPNPNPEPLPPDTTVPTSVIAPKFIALTAASSTVAMRSTFTPSERVSGLGPTGNSSCCDPQLKVPRARKTTFMPYVRPLNQTELKKCQDFAKMPCRILPRPLPIPDKWVPLFPKMPMAPPMQVNPNNTVKVILVQSSEPVLPKPPGPKSSEDSGKFILANPPKPSISVSPGVAKPKGTFTKITTSTSISIAPAAPGTSTAGNLLQKRPILAPSDLEGPGNSNGPKRVLDKKMLDLIRAKTGGGDIRKVIFTNGGRDIISIMALPPTNQNQSPKKDPKREPESQQSREDARQNPPATSKSPKRNNPRMSLEEVGARRFLGGPSDKGRELVDVLIVDSGKNMKILRSQMPLMMRGQLEQMAAQSEAIEAEAERDADASPLIGGVAKRIEAIRVKAEEAGIPRAYQKPETVLKVRKVPFNLRTRLLRGLRYNVNLDMKAIALSQMFVEEAVLSDLRAAKLSVTNTLRHSNRKALVGIQIMKLKSKNSVQGHVYVLFRGNSHANCLTAPEEVSIRLIHPDEGDNRSSVQS